MTDTLERYHAAVRRLLDLFPHDPIPKSDPAHFLIERLEALLNHNLLAPREAPVSGEFRPLYLARCSGCGACIVQGPPREKNRGQLASLGIGSEIVRELRFACTCDGRPPITIEDVWEPITELMPWEKRELEQRSNCHNSDATLRAALLKLTAAQTEAKEQRAIAEKTERNYQECILTRDQHWQMAMERLAQVQALAEELKIATQACTTERIRGDNAASELKRVLEGERAAFATLPPVGVGYCPDCKSAMLRHLVGVDVGVVECACPRMLHGALQAAIIAFANSLDAEVKR